MAVIFTAEQAAQITTALVDKINTADTKATNAASAAAAADTKATNAASAAAAADTKATNAASAAAAAQTTANSKQRQLYKHVIHLGAASEDYASDVVITLIDSSNANLTVQQICDVLNSREASISLVSSDTHIPLDYYTNFTIHSTTINAQCKMLANGEFDSDYFEFTIANFTQTTTAL